MCHALDITEGNMKITKEKIKKLEPCLDGYQWYVRHGSPDLLETLLDVNKVNPEWAAWLYIRLMSEKQRKQFAIYAAEQVLHIFEASHPDDKRPRLAIAAAKKALKSNTKANRDAAYGAACAAACAGAASALAAADYAAPDVAGYGAPDAAGADLSLAASYAASAASYAAGAGYTAANSTAFAAANAARAAIADTATTACASIAMQEKLIRKAVKLLEKQ